MYSHYKSVLLYIILTNKFLLKTNQNVKKSLESVHRRDLVLFKNKKKYIGIGIGKNPVSCIPNLYCIKHYISDLTFGPESENTLATT